MTTSGRKLTDLELDVRVRERLLASGAITAEDIDAHTSTLPDLEEQYEALPFEQPALAAGAGARMEHVSTATDEGLE